MALPNLVANGAWNGQTRWNWQAYLKDQGHYLGILDGDFGPMSIEAVQKHLRATGYYPGLIDGDFGLMSSESLHRFLWTYWGCYSFLQKANQSQMYTRPWAPRTGGYLDEYIIDVTQAVQSGLSRYGDHPY